MRKSLIFPIITLFLVYSSCATPTVQDRLLLTAVGNSDVEGTTDAIRNGARVNVRSTSEEFYKFTPLMISAWNGDTELSKLLINSGADINAKTKNRGTAVLWASYKDHVSVVQLLVAAGADLNIAQKNAGENTGYTPLIWACGLNHIEVVELLTKNNADLEMKDLSGTTALMWATYYGYAEIARILLDAGADVNAQNTGGETVLMGSLFSDSPEMVALLLEAGADVTVRDNEGQTAFEWTQTWVRNVAEKYPEIVEMLVEAEGQM